MAYEFKLPDIGEGVVEGEIVDWKVAVGERIERDQPLVEVMTDKATVEIPSPRAGTIREIAFEEGAICPVGAVLVVIDDGAETGASASVPGNAAEAQAATVGEVPAASSSADPATSDARTEARPPPRAPAPLFRDDGAAQDGGRVKAAPAARRLARQLGVALAQVVPTGPRGRVTSEDVRHAADPSATGEFAVEVPTEINLPAAAAAAAPAPASASAATARAPQRSAGFAPMAIAAQGNEERIPLRGMRKRIADNMQRAKATAAHFTYVEEIDMSDLVDVRQRAKERAAERGLKLTYLPFLIKAVVSGLKKWPQLNAALDETTQEIVRKKYYHIGIASQGPNGLVVTVLRDADRRSIFDLAAEIQRLSRAVEEGTIKRDELSGSTFTITSLGKLGGVMATPIINFPEVGIMGVHEMKQRPAVHKGEIAIRWLMNLSISLDHRLVDGWDGAMFLQDVKQLLEDPTTMFMEMV